eukprot:scaffold2639_cov385-Prasinococcus_capsulatus_cf.AAC.11
MHASSASIGPATWIAPSFTVVRLTPAHQRNGDARIAGISPELKMDPPVGQSRARRVVSHRVPNARCREALNAAASGRICLTAIHFFTGISGTALRDVVIDS